MLIFVICALFCYAVSITLITTHYAKNMYDLCHTSH